MTEQEIRDIVQEMFPQFIPHVLSENRIHKLADSVKQHPDGSLLRDRSLIHLLQQSTLAEALAAKERGESTEYLKEYLADYKRRGIV